MIDFTSLKIRDQMFSSEEKECGWLLGFINDQLKHCTDLTRDFWISEMQKATDWKKKLNTKGKIVNPVKNWNKEEIINL